MEIVIVDDVLKREICGFDDRKTKNSFSFCFDTILDRSFFRMDRYNNTLV